MTPLPLLGSHDGIVGSINNRGEVAGIAENGTRDDDCPLTPALNGTGSLAFDFEAVIWGRGELPELHPLPGDTVGAAFWINDNGQAVGVSGLCSNTTLPGFGREHALVGDSEGMVSPSAAAASVNVAVAQAPNCPQHHREGHAHNSTLRLDFPSQRTAHSRVSEKLEECHAEGGLYGAFVP
jgi:hypothetical protein